MDRLRWATAFFCVLLLVQIIRAVRREHIRVEFSMAWFAAAAALLGLSLWDAGLRTLSDWLGVDSSPIVLLYLGGLAFLFTFFRFSVEVSALKDHNIQVSQKLGLLQWEIRRQAAEIRRLRGEPEREPSEE